MDDVTLTPSSSHVNSMVLPSWSTWQRACYPVLSDTGLLVGMVALDHRVVVGGGAGRQALFRLVSGGAVS